MAVIVCNRMTDAHYVKPEVFRNCVECGEECGTNLADFNDATLEGQEPKVMCRPCFESRVSSGCAQLECRTTDGQAERMAKLLGITPEQFKELFKRATDKLGVNAARNLN